MRALEAQPPGGPRHLRRLMATWGLLADFCFSDLVLYIPGAGDEYVMMGHVRPTTAPTIYHDELVGETRSAAQRPLVHEAMTQGHVTVGDIDSAWLDDHIRVTAIPIRLNGTVVGVLARESPQAVRVRAGELEDVYGRVFDSFAAMLSEGTFPYRDEETLLAAPPRVGDGVVVVNAQRIVEYASPNAVSALSRFGAEGNHRGRTLAASGFVSHAVRTAVDSGRPGVDELENNVIVAVRALPLFEGGRVTGAVVLLRDVTDVRRRDRLLVSKDATIREIHHRVKNNLQTISSLLRLQGRRLTEPSAKAAIEESVRRIGSIALVHETLSHAASDDVPFAAVLRPLIRMVEDGLVSSDRPLAVRIDGDAGVLPSDVATSLAVVLTELIQNVVQHAYPPFIDLDVEPANVVVELRPEPDRLVVRVRDDGVGMEWEPDEPTSSLGLSIVRTLVESELGGTIAVESAHGKPPRRGTVITVNIPIDVDVAMDPTAQDAGDE